MYFQKPTSKLWVRCHLCGHKRELYHGILRDAPKLKLAIVSPLRLILWVDEPLIGAVLLSSQAMLPASLARRARCRCLLRVDTESSLFPLCAHRTASKSGVEEKVVGLVISDESICLSPAVSPSLSLAI